MHTHTLIYTHLFLPLALSILLYLHISWLMLSFIPVVSQGGKRYIVNQLLEPLIACHKVCLTVHLHERDEGVRRPTCCPPKKKKKKRRKSVSETANEFLYQWAYLHHYCCFISYKHTDQALFGFAILELACFAPALLLGLLMQPRLCLNVWQNTLNSHTAHLFHSKDLTQC